MLKIYLKRIINNNIDNFVRKLIYGIVIDGKKECYYGDWYEDVLLVIKKVDLCVKLVYISLSKVFNIYL